MLGKLSGRHAFRDKLETMGYVLDDAAFEDAFRRFKDLADKKKHVFDEDIVALVDDEIVRGQDTITVKALQGRDRAPASSPMAVTDPGRSMARNAASPPRATARWTPSSRPSARLYPHTATLQLFQISAVTEGTDAQATVSVRLEENGRTVTGKASDTDTMVAAAYAYVNALNKLLVKREKQAPEALTVAQMRQDRLPAQRAGAVFRRNGACRFCLAFQIRDRQVKHVRQSSWRAFERHGHRSWDGEHAGLCQGTRHRAQRTLGGRHHHHPRRQEIRPRRRQRRQDDAGPHPRQHRGDPPDARRRHRRFRSGGRDDQALHPQGA